MTQIGESGRGALAQVSPPTRKSALGEKQAAAGGGLKLEMGGGLGCHASQRVAGAQEKLVERATIVPSAEPGESLAFSGRNLGEGLLLHERDLGEGRLRSET